MSSKILIVEDEANIRRMLQIALHSEGYQALEAESAFAAKQWLNSTAFSCILLDLGLPDEDGKSLVRFIRTLVDTPIIVISAREHEQEKIAALDAGANDYITKPFNVGELCARIRAATRNKKVVQVAEQLSDKILTIDFAARLVTLNGEPLELTRKEYQVLEALARAPERVVTQTQLLCDIWGPTHAEDSHYLRIVISHLRRKLDCRELDHDHQYIHTEQAVGYRLKLL